MRILALNPGSSTLKFGLFDMTSDKEVMHGKVDRLGTDDGVLEMAFEGGEVERKSVGSIKLDAAVELVLSHVGDLAAIGCRVVHGGTTFDGPVLVDAGVYSGIEKLAPLAPLHNSRDLETIAVSRRNRPQVPVVAVFDTVFHRDIPEAAATYAVPATTGSDFPVRRFGFHGISYQFITDQLSKARGTEKGKVIACHLGSGASICAILDGKSIDTSMGMTPLEGLIMGTRCGDIDPGAVLYLLREQHLSHQEVDYLLNHDSGLLGLSGVSADVRVLEAKAKEGHAAAELALDAFAYRVAKYIGSYFVALSGLDALIFSGGIGENSADMRNRVCHKLSSLGIDPELPILAPDKIVCLTTTKTPSVWVIKTDEEKQIAIETAKLVSA